MGQTQQTDAPVTDAAAELERRRALGRARASRYRERKKHETASRDSAPAAPEPAAPPQNRPAGESSAPQPGPARPIQRPTRRLEEIGAGGPERYAEVPPAAFADVAPPPTAEEAERATKGASKFAAAVAFMFKMSLDDAVQRYGAAALEEFGVKASDVDDVKSAAVQGVFERAQRCAEKWGIDFTLPYEDELVTLGAAGGSAAYLFAKVTGRLDEPATPATSPSSAPKRERAAAGDVDEKDADEHEAVHNAPLRRGRIHIG